MNINTPVSKFGPTPNSQLISFTWSLELPPLEHSGTLTRFTREGVLSYPVQYMHIPHTYIGHLPGCVISGRGAERFAGRHTLDYYTRLCACCVSRSWTYSERRKPATSVGAAAAQTKEAAWVNPLTLRAAKRGLTILKISQLQKHFLEIIWGRSVDQKPNNKSPSNIFRTFA